MKDTENSEWHASLLVDHEIGQDPIKKDLLIREIGAAVTAVRDIRQLVETREQFSDDSVGRLHALLL